MYKVGRANSEIELASKILEKINKAAPSVDTQLSIEGVVPDITKMPILENIEQWRTADIADKAVVITTVLEKLGRDKWEFCGLYLTHNFAKILTDCQICNSLDRVKRYGCNECGKKKMSINVNHDNTVLLVNCKECEASYEVLVPNPSYLLRKTGPKPKVQRYYPSYEFDQSRYSLSQQGVCPECMSNVRYYSSKDLSIAIPVFRHLPTGIIFHLIPGRKNVDHKEICHTHKVTGITHFCQYPDKECCCYIGTHHIKPFLISKTPISWKQSDVTTPNILGFGKFKGFAGRSYQELVEENFPITLVDQRQATKWLETQGLRLPNYLEWSYAFKAGSPTAYPWGDEKEDCSMSICSVENSYFKMKTSETNEAKEYKMDVNPNFIQLNLDNHQKFPSVVSDKSPLPNFLFEANELDSNNPSQSLPDFMRFHTEITKFLNNPSESFDFVNEIMSSEEISPETKQKLAQFINSLKEEPYEYLSIHPISNFNKACCNGFGLSDMLGNVWEFVDSLDHPPLIAGGSAFTSWEDFPSPETNFTIPCVAPYGLDIGFRAAVDIPE